MSKIKIAKEDLWDELEGIMKHVKKRSIELQHEIGDYRTERNIRKIKKGDNRLEYDGVKEIKRIEP